MDEGAVFTESVTAFQRWEVGERTRKHAHAHTPAWTHARTHRHTHTHTHTVCFVAWESYICLEIPALMASHDLAPLCVMCISATAHVCACSFYERGSMRLIPALMTSCDLALGVKFLFVSPSIRVDTHTPILTHTLSPKHTKTHMRTHTHTHTHGCCRSVGSCYVINKSTISN